MLRKRITPDIRRTYIHEIRFKRVEAAMQQASAALWGMQPVSEIIASFIFNVDLII